MAFNASSPASSVATASSHNKPRHERPICTHCGFTWHTVDSSFTEPLKSIHYFPSAAATKGSFPPPPLSSDQQTIDPLESSSTSGPSISQIYGSVRLFDTLNLDNVLFVPMFTFNLLSISALTLSHNFHIDIWGPFNVTTPIGHDISLLLLMIAHVLLGVTNYLTEKAIRSTFLGMSFFMNHSFRLLIMAVSNGVINLFNDRVLPKPIQSISKPSYSQPNMSSSHSPKCIFAPAPIQTTLCPRRVTTKPTYLFDYHYYLTEHVSSKPSLYPISSCLTDGTVDRYKARLMAKGFTQQEGIDYLDTFSPAAKLVIVKMLLSLAAIHGWSLTQLDVTNAFLHGDLMKEVHMSLPLGYTCHKGEHLPSNVVCRLHNDHTLFTKHQDTSFLALLIYIDDIIIASNDQIVVDTLKHALNCKFKMKNLGPLRYFLGLEVDQSIASISICQRKYALELLSTSDIWVANLLPFPWILI
ncbi:hypothetical protein AAG906_024701 [Vitis piasezkii]